MTRTQPTAPANDDERALLERLRSGDATAFPLLVRPHLSALLSLARRLAGDHQWAEDLVQETLLRAHRYLASFRGEASVRTWLFRIQTRLAGEPQRWRRAERAASTTPTEVPDRFDHCPPNALLQRELGDRLDEALERLTPRQRIALHLRAVEGLDYNAIALAMDCRPAAARMLVLAARRHVTARMGRYLTP